MPAALTSAQKMVWDLQKGDYVMESGIIKIISPKDIKAHQYMMVNSKKKCIFEHIFIKLIHSYSSTR